ncbi:hypothetical protein SRB5_58380 [Streptomyces sp. RB5]|uniref:HTH cro/C1-type domain-containing protein n=1 Tax=Streptomyces smaragdinus TaxID=2585196 RepID=A0A7K0CQ87_9ACTN|nr:helix-turn-helix transcriptional regulator [Streptomyces smaragdinus]MQY15650.1 hypothetical protein [Streptomyces smaragdinus]
MKPAKKPTARQARLGAELRKLREAAGVSGADAAAHLGGERSLMSHVEAGRWGIKPERVQFLASYYEVGDQELVQALIAMARERGEGWWGKYHGVLPPALLDLAELEHHAKYLRTAQALIMPGIFQTEDYARAVYRAAIPGPSEDETNAQVEHRLRRRDIFERESPTPYEAILHEAALQINYGSRDISRRQLEHILEVAELPNISVRVIPFSVEVSIGFTPQLFYAGGPVPQLDTVVIEGAHGMHFVNAEVQLKKYRSLFSAIEELSLSADESRKMIHRIAKEK